MSQRAARDAEEETRPSSSSRFCRGGVAVADVERTWGRLPRWLFNAAGKSGLVGMLVLSPPSSPAAGVVTNLNELAFRQMVASGGSVTFAVAGTLALTSPILVTNETSIGAAGFNVRLSGRGSNALFHVASGLTLAHLTLADGHAIQGGGLWVQPTGRVVATNCLFTGNRAVGTNGVAGAAGGESSGIGGDGQDGEHGQDASGGAIFSEGQLTLLRCQFLTNSATGGDGGAGGNGGDGAFRGGNGGRGGKGGAALGGAVRSTGSLIVSNCTFAGNIAVARHGADGGAAGEGGNVPLNGNGGAGGRSSGAALCVQANSTILNCTFEGNRGFGGNSAAGGQRANTNGSDGPAGGDAEGAALWTAGSCRVTNCTFSANEVIGGNGGDGGHGTLIGGNGGRGGYGAGGSIFNAGDLGVVHCTLSGGSSVGGFGALAGEGQRFGETGKDASTRGGNIASGGGTFTLKSSILAFPVSGTNSYTFTNVVTVETNVAVEVTVVSTNTFYSTNTGCPLPGPPGSIPPTCTTNVVLTNASVISTNTFFLTNSPLCGTLNLNPACLTNVVLTALVTSNYTVTFQVTNIVNATNVAAALNAYGAITDAGHNLSSDASPAFGSNSWHNTDPKLGPLADNGGPTRTYALSSNCPALNAGDSAVVLSFDQRGFLRPTGGRPDIGAVEMGAPVIHSQPQSRSVTNGAAVQLTVTASGEVAPAYQWRFNGQDLAGATGTKHSLTNVQLSDAGAYTVVVANPFGAVTSQVAMLTVVFQTRLFPPWFPDATNLALQFTTRTGQDYVLEYRDTLSHGDWVRLNTNAGSGGLRTILVPTPGVPSRFFRVVEQ